MYESRGERLYRDVELWWRDDDEYDEDA